MVPPMLVHEGSDYDYSIHYRTWHDESPDHVRAVTAYHRNHLRPHVPKPSDGPVLDVGCGMGFALLALRSLGFTNLTGIDRDEAQCASARRLGLNVERVGDAVEFLSSHPGTYSLILMLDLLEHIPVSRQIPSMRAVHNALMPGGRVILTVPNASSILAPRWRYIDFTHHASFTEHSLRFVLRNAGFPDVTIPPSPPLQRPWLRLWRQDARQMFRRWLVRFVWRQVLIAEIGHVEHVDAMSLELNLTAVAVKSLDETTRA